MQTHEIIEVAVKSVATAFEIEWRELFRFPQPRILSQGVYGRTQMTCGCYYCNKEFKCHSRRHMALFCNQACHGSYKIKIGFAVRVLGYVLSMRLGRESAMEVLGIQERRMNDIMSIMNKDYKDHITVKSILKQIDTTFYLGTIKGAA